MTYHSEVVGSLLRPTYLAEARKRFEAGQLPASAFKKLEDQAVDEAIALQEAAGVEVITDGEQRRYAFFGHLIDALDGFDKLGGWAIPFRNESGEQLILQRPVVVEKLRWRRSMCTNSSLLRFFICMCIIYKIIKSPLKCIVKSRIIEY